VAGHFDRQALGRFRRHQAEDIGHLPWRDLGSDVEQRGHLEPMR
jgi:hypothetical protein